MGEIVTVMQGTEKPVKSVPNQHPRVVQFHHRVVAIMDGAHDRESAAGEIAVLFGAMEQAGFARERALMSDYRRVASAAGVNQHMLASVVRSAGREIETSARLAGTLHHHRAVEAEVLHLCTQWAEEFPEVVQQLRDVLLTTPTEQQQPHRSRPSLLATMPAPGGPSVGWFLREGSTRDEMVRFPFVGYSVVATPGDSGHFQGVESTFDVEGHWWPISQLNSAGYVLDHID